MDVNSKNQTQELESVFKNSPNLVNIASPDGRMTFLNEAGQKMLGISQAEVAGYSISNAFPKNWQDKLSKEILPALQNKGFWEGDVQYQNAKTKKIIDAHVKCFSVKDEKTGKVKFYVNESFDISEHMRIKESEVEAIFKFKERNKELKCLYNIAEIVETLNITLEEILKKVVLVLPDAWQYPEISCARIIFSGREYKTEKFKVTKWRQSCEMKLPGDLGLKMIVEVYYLKEKPEMEEGPFLKEERRLINAIAERLLRVSERKKIEKIIEEEREMFKKFFNSSNDAIMTLSPPNRNFANGNAETFDMFGVKDKKEFISLSPSDLSPKMQLNGKLTSLEAKKNIMQALKDGRFNFEWMHKRYKGEDFPARVSLVKINIKGDDFIMATVRDMTWEKDIANKIDEKTKNLEKINALMVGREMKMIELKKEIIDLKKRLNKK